MVCALDLLPVLSTALISKAFQIPWLVQKLGDIEWWNRIGWICLVGGFHQGGSATNGATQTMPVVHNMCPLHVNSESRRGTASVTNRQTNGQT